MTARGDHVRYLLSLVRDELVRTDRAEQLDEFDYDRLCGDLSWLHDRVAGALAQTVHEDELERQRAVRARERARGLDGDAGSGLGEGSGCRVSVEATADAVDQEVVR